MAIEGRLGVGGGADLLTALWFQGRSGILDLVAGGVDRKFVMAVGEVVYVVSSANAERLTVRLAARGLVDKAALVDAAKAGGDLRQVLAERGVLEAESHDRELAALIGDAVAAVFALTDGKWSFVDRSDLVIPGSLASLDLAPILWDVARRADPAFASAFLGDHAQRLTKEGDDELLTSLPGLTPQEGYVISRIDGYGSVRDLVASSPLGEPATLQLVLALTCVGYTDVTGRPSVRLPRPPKGSTTRKKSAPKPAARPAAVMTAVAPTSAEPAVAIPSGPRDPVEEARHLHATLEGANHYGVLGVPRTATADEIRRAYYALARLHHPDRHGSALQGADRELVESLFARIGVAFAVLSTEDKRQDYDARLASGALAAEHVESKAVDPRDLARESAAKARAALASGDRARALQYFEHAVQTDPESWEHRMALARLLLSDGRTRRRAEPHLVAAISIDPAKPDAYHELGRVYAAANLKTRALEQYRKGLEWDSGHAGILAGIAELGEPGSDDTSGLLGGLFGKKKP